MSVADLPSSEGFAVDYLLGVATCGYCAQTFGWPGPVGAAIAKGYLTLSGWVALAMDDETDSVVVVFEAMAGEMATWLPHACVAIPADVVAEAMAEVRP